MEVVKQQCSLPIQVLDFKSDIRSGRHGDLFPGNVRALILGSSSAGKTNVLLNLLVHENGLRFENLYIYSKSLYQPKYQYLFNLLKNIQDIGVEAYENGDKVVQPNEAKENSIFIFDDVINEKQDKIASYYSMGRHRNVDSIYLAQSYAKVPKHLIRDNANMIVLFKQDNLNLKHIYEDYVSTDMTFNEFRDLCKNVWESGQGRPFVVIIPEFPLNNGRYRNGFDVYIKVENNSVVQY